MQKHKHLNRWLWKWHIIAGLITLPLMILLAVTGIIYLFKGDYEDSVYSHLKQVEIGTETLPYADQLKAAQALAKQPITGVVLPTELTQATEFVSGMRRGKSTIYVNPYTGEALGAVKAADTLMMTVRKLHGELLLGKGGTYTVELAASWFVVLILTGIYVWWPSTGFALAGFFTVRTSKGKRIFYRDLHSVLAFWLSVFMLVLLSGAMPWTDIFGSQLKWVQAQTDTGYPKTWQRPAGLKSVAHGQPISLDAAVEITKRLGLKGQITIKFPKGTEGVISVSNRSLLLRHQEVLHFDQYSGDLIKRHTWDDVGILMDMRQVAMRLHQGEYGLISWYAVLLTALVFALSTLAGLISYIKRKPAGEWGLPKVPDHWRVGYGIVALLVILAAVFPLFGASVILIAAFEKLKSFKGV
ncbi:PepSY domain-containing protein [Kordiimonas sp. SCSIO 12603]|uniref:PepSY-associated TM helix domain-containing protein n=1 Tax=Kordiimonas sp. SCSIO 12603 TaxID=2829596 RepID=UPI002106A56A|nr:PepSY domain-containing protein [Kordiimonas sp. SCSIO 12603]UTW58594.1 PepSY domain-containing protein [Kordiimonas sp. SCSIO 12603]